MTHSLKLGERMLRKGSMLDEAALAALEAASRCEVIAARLAPGEVPEDACADRLADLFAEPLIARSRAATGRVNFLAASARLLRVAHEEEAIAAALERLLDNGAEMLLVAGASAVVDRCDVASVAITRMGGEILHFGMPVDPGNLMVIGRIGMLSALVLPGCARSPKPNRIDSVLARLFAGFPVGRAEIARMGVGGLLKESEERGLKRAAVPAVRRTGSAPQVRGAVAAVVLAAGRSRRSAPQNKLLASTRWDKPLIARVVDNVLSSSARPILVVLGHQAEEIERALPGRPVQFVYAADYAKGLAASLKAGIAAVPAEAGAAIVCLGDMPLVTASIINRLISAYNPDEGRLIVLPTFRGKQGNPMLWDRRYFAEIMALEGDSGARHLLAQHLEQVAEVEMGSDAVLRDADTPEALTALSE